MNRRTFLASAGTAAAGAEYAGAAAPENAPNCYLLQTYYLRNSSQGPRLNRYMSEGLLPALAKLQGGPKIFLEALVAAHMPQFVVLLGMNSLDEAAGLRARLRDDAAFRKAFDAWENDPEPPYEHYSQAILKPAGYPADPIPAPSAKPRIFELRTYHSPTWKQLAALHQRFAGPESRIFHRCGIHPVLFSETLVGPNMPNLTYLTPFESLAAREKAWDAFGADPEWLKVRKESIAAHGQISSVIQITILRAAEYSPVR